MQDCDAYGLRIEASMIKNRDLVELLRPPMTTIEVLAEALGISRTAAVGMVKRGEIASVKVGAIYRVQTGPIRRMIGMDSAPQSVEAKAA